MSILKIARDPYMGLAVNCVFALGNCAVGFLSHSWWFLTMGAYYAVLAVTRFSVLQVQRKAAGNLDTELFAKRITGILFIFLSLCLIGINTLSAIKERGTVFHEIIMIAIATYTFTKITLAITGLIKAGRVPSPTEKTLRNISFTDAFVSIYTLQRSMLVSFPGMEPDEIRLLNILTGTAVWMLVLLLGINLIGGRRVDMAKSKIAKVNKKIAGAITHGYKEIEKGVVCGYTKIEDRFVAAYLTRDGETVEEAKKRLKEEK